MERMNFKDETIQYDVFGCARCGEDHPTLEFKKFSNQPVGDQRGVYAFWGLCPVKQEPVIGTLTIMFEVTGYD